jgi:quercetin dioxygenase-like cupin family protein
MSNIFKIWGERKRIFINDQTEIDLLYLKKDHFCSTHSHKYKINRFVVVSGKVKIETEYGDTILTKNESWEVNPPILHRFIALEDSVMIELAFVNKGKINPDDINRLSQGGKIVNGKELTLNNLKKEGLLKL